MPSKFLLIGCGLALTSAIALTSFPDDIVVITSTDDVKQELRVDTDLLILSDIDFKVMHDAVLVDNGVMIMNRDRADVPDFVSTEELRDLREKPRIRDDLVYT